jgi:hypothetical protein
MEWRFTMMLKDGKTCSLGTGGLHCRLVNFDVNITVPADHVMETTGDLTNRSKYLLQSKRYELATKSYDKPVVIVTQLKAGKQLKGFRKKHGNLALKTLEILVLQLLENSFMMPWQ